MTDKEKEELVARLRARTVATLPRDWQKGLKCPANCGFDAARPKCAWEDSNCPRHDPSNYSPDPHVYVQDKDAAAAADLIEDGMQMSSALVRLGSMEAFDHARTINPTHDKELVARIDFARAQVK